MNKKRASLIIPVAAALACAACSGAKKSADGAAAPAKEQKYQFTAVSKGSIESTVSSSGTLEPVSEVSVLPQMGGRALKVYADYNQRVKKGQLLVELDTTMLKLSERESAAAVKKAQATYDLQATLVANNEKLAAKGLISEYDLASSKSSLKVDAAELESAQAALSTIQTQINNYAFVTSPIDGIVLARSVEAGQTVVEGSSSNSTSLFTLAEDLSKMEIEVDVDELDIGSIRSGQEARFTVEALPGKTIMGKVREIHLVPTESDNVVTYTVIVDAPNADGKLLPGMTAQVEFIKEKKDNVLIVPSAALRFQPAGLSAAEIAKMEFLAGLGDISAEEKAKAEAGYDEMQKAKAAEAQASKPAQASGLSGLMMGGGGPGFGGPGQRRSGANGQSGAPAAGAAVAVRKPLWYQGADGKLACAMVAVGATDGKNTEVSGPANLEGLKVILKAKVE
jgi:HlyD family secretion protein